MDIVNNNNNNNNAADSPHTWLIVASLTMSSSLIFLQFNNRTFTISALPLQHWMCNRVYPYYSHTQKAHNKKIITNGNTLFLLLPFIPSNNLLTHQFFSFDNSQSNRVQITKYQIPAYTQYIPYHPLPIVHTRPIIASFLPYSSRRHPVEYHLSTDVLLSLHDPFHKLYTMEFFLPVYTQPMIRKAMISPSALSRNLL